MSNKFEPPRFVRALSRKPHRPKSRYCLKIDESEMSLLRCKADLQEEESFVMLIDDSAFCRRTKNVVFTNKRILWQEKRGAPYKSISLESLSCASVFFEPLGFGSVITVLNGNSFTQFRFKNIRAGDSLRIIFHDYLSRCCEGYAPPENENEARYKKLCVPSFKRRSIPSLLLAAAGSAMIFIYVISLVCGIGFFERFNFLRLGIVFWTVNMFLPVSKSKVSKAFMLVIFSIYSAVVFGTHDDIAFSRIVCIVSILGFLKIDRFELDEVVKIMPIVAGTLALLMVSIMRYF